MTIAFTFPGQGSQSVGMGKLLAENFDVARDVFIELDDVLQEKLSSLMFDGDENLLTLTKNAQPAIMAVSIATLRVMQYMGLDLSHVKVVAGHSLGEYSALCCAGVLSLKDTIKLLRLRGEAMQRAVAPNQGAMAAIIGCDIKQIEDLCDNVAKIGVCEIANDNGAGQIVISGEKNAIEQAIKEAADFGAKRALLLPVSAPFHCSLMQSAAEEMKEAFKRIEFKQPQIAVLPNVNVELQRDAKNIAELLYQQIVGRVRWRETVEWFENNSVKCCYEIGWGKVLTNLCKRITKNIEAENIYDIKAMEEAVKKINLSV